MDKMPDTLTQSPQWIFEHVRNYIDGQLTLIQAELDRRFETSRRETDRIFAERKDRFDESFTNIRREIEIINSASELAISKAETATEKRLYAMNEWRQQSLDRERATAEDRSKLESAMLPREVFETWKASVDNQLSEDKGGKQATGEIRTWVFSIAALLLSLGTLIFYIASH